MNKKTFLFITGTLILIIIGLVVANFNLNRKASQHQLTGPESTISIFPATVDTSSEQAELEKIVIEEDETEIDSLHESANQL